MTERLYYKDSHLETFTAKVLACEIKGDIYGIVLDRTAFFPPFLTDKVYSAGGSIGSSSETCLLYTSYWGESLSQWPL